MVYVSFRRSKVIQTRSLRVTCLGGRRKRGGGGGRGEGEGAAARIIKYMEERAGKGDKVELLNNKTVHKINKI